MATNTIDEKYHRFIENGVNQGKSNIEVTKELWKKYGENSVGASTVTLWMAVYKAVAESAKSSNSDSVDQNQILIQNGNKNKRKPDNKSKRDLDLEQEENVCKVEKNAKKGSWYTFNWKNQDATDPRECPF